MSVVSPRAVLSGARADELQFKPQTSRSRQTPWSIPLSTSLVATPSTFNASLTARLSSGVLFEWNCCW